MDSALPECARPRYFIYISTVLIVVCLACVRARCSSSSSSLLIVLFSACAALLEELYTRTHRTIECSRTNTDWPLNWLCDDRKAYSYLGRSRSLYALHIPTQNPYMRCTISVLADSPVRYYCRQLRIAQSAQSIFISHLICLPIAERFTYKVINCDSPDSISFEHRTHTGQTVTKVDQCPVVCATNREQKSRKAESKVKKKIKKINIERN